MYLYVYIYTDVAFLLLFHVCMYRRAISHITKTYINYKYIHGHLYGSFYVCTYR